MSSAPMALSGVGHISFDQLKVMNAIERCRTAALGGHVRAALTARMSTSPTTRAATAIAPNVRRVRADGEDGCRDGLKYWRRNRRF